MCYTHKTQDAVLTTLSWPLMNISDILDHQKQFVCFQQDAERYVAEKHWKDFFEEGTEYSDDLLKDVESILKRVVLLFFQLAPWYHFLV